ncbi:phosphoglucosamine mutase [Halobacteriales archaeon SW_7_68_16]|nr:MAG: phosphoglucosamine mutase [Halobacteriales archaeon SW_7_68_16]
MEIFGSSGTRGVVNETLTVEFAARVAAAAGSVWDAGEVALARDTRHTGRMLADAVAAGLASSGLKLVGADGVELTVEDLERIEGAIDDGVTGAVQWDETGTSRRVEIVREAYVEEVVGGVDRERIAGADLTVALDPGHGAGGLTSPEIFRRLGCDVVTVNAQPDGHFPGRDPEPVAGNLDDLGRLVRASDADVGIAHDGDADRAIFFDERGAFVEGDAALAVLAAEELTAGDAVVSAVNVSQRLVDVAEAVGADLHLTPIGSTSLITRIEALRAAGESVPIAGEGNGGVFFPPYRLCRDGAYTAARLLELLVERPLSGVTEPYDDYYNVRKNVAYDGDGEWAAMRAAIEDRADDADAEVTTVDGHRLDYGDAWVLARESGTEPVFRVYAESADPDRAGELARGMAETIRAARDRP